MDSLSPVPSFDSMCGANHAPFALEYPVTSAEESKAVPNVSPTLRQKSTSFPLLNHDCQKSCKKTWPAKRPLLLIPFTDWQHVPLVDPPGSKAVKVPFLQTQPPSANVPPP